ncbi:secondary thiamine-phosphate synthase enzyme YjbQ [Propionivibrio sp.]|uniref:secondary thiamine-phosphate synthase enzyme YjbQ n=1 Tax=Propionivibrio sp. TaxID=2212460 RepID=UPI003BF30AA0
MSYQQTIDISTRGRGTTEITTEVSKIVRASRIETGLANVFVLHTSCSVILTENADPSVRRDLETLALRWAPDGDPAYQHNNEGDDDMAAHGRNILAGSSISVPVSKGEPLLGTWQGIYLWEHRTHAQRRSIVVTVLG